MEGIGARICEIRKSNKLTQKDFGRKLGVSGAHISNIESGNDYPSDSLIKLISIVFSINEKWIKCESEIKYKEHTNNKHFVKENIDLIRGNMTYSQMSADIANKLGNELFQDVFDEKYLKDVAKGSIVPTRERILTLAKYTQVLEDFFYRDNKSFEDVLIARDEYKKIQENRKDSKALTEDISHLSKELYDFIIDKDNLKYLEFSKKVKEKGINPDDIVNFVLKY